MNVSHPASLSLPTATTPPPQTRSLSFSTCPPDALWLFHLSQSSHWLWLQPLHLFPLSLVSPAVINQPISHHSLLVAGLWYLLSCYLYLLDLLPVPLFINHSEKLKPHSRISPLHYSIIVVEGGSSHFNKDKTNNIFLAFRMSLEDRHSAPKCSSFCIPVIFSLEWASMWSTSLLIFSTKLGQPAVTAQGVGTN